MKSEAMPAKEEKKDGFDKYEIDSAVDALLRAEDVKSDKKLMAACEGALAKKYKAIQSIQDLKDTAAEMDEEGDEE